MSRTTQSASIEPSQRLVSAKYQSGTEILTYDDGIGPIFISRNSIGVNGIVRARTWHEVYEICKDEFFPEASETTEELVKEYGFRVEHKVVVKDPTSTTASEHLAAGERFAVYPDDYPNGRLLPEFVRYTTIETPDPDAWMENPCFQEGFGFRPNGPNERDTVKHGIYSKDLNGDSLDRLTDEMLRDWEIVLEIEDEDEVSEEDKGEDN